MSERLWNCSECGVTCCYKHGHSSRGYRCPYCEIDRLTSELAEAKAALQKYEGAVEVEGVVEGYRSIGNDRGEPDEACLELSLPKEFIGQPVTVWVEKEGRVSRCEHGQPYVMGADRVICVHCQLASVQAQLASALAELETCKENYRNEVYECSLLQAELEELRERYNQMSAIYKAMVDNAGLAQDKLTERIVKLTAENQALREEVERLRKREGNAMITLCVPTDNDPFRRMDCRVVDYGVSDNIYVVESDEINTLQQTAEHYRKALEVIAKADPTWYLFSELQKIAADALEGK